MQDSEFYARLKALGMFKAERLAKQPSDRALAERTGLTPTTIGDWLRGNRFPGDVDKLVTVVHAIASVAKRRGAESPDGLLDTDWWREAHAAEKRRREAHDPDDAAPGRPLAQWTNPFDLEVHPPVQADDPALDLPDLPPYIPRDHDEKLAELARAARDGRSGIAVLVGGSSTGKTRACWETLKTLDIPNGSWRLWHPLSPTPAAAALRDLPLIAPSTVLWLNEAQRYLDTRDRQGEELAAALRELLRDPARSPLLILATLWPDDWRKLTTRPPHGESDPRAQARELLSGHEIAVPPAFTDQQLRALAESSDPRLRRAAESATDGRVTQFLAGARELLSRYETAEPATKALITAAMDARRLGMGEAIPRSFLEAAAPAYLDGPDLDMIEEEADWIVGSLADVAQSANGVRGPLTRIRVRGEDSSYRLADYLEQHARRERLAVIPPADFWRACEVLTDPGELRVLGEAAESRGLLRHASRLYKRAAVLGDAEAIVQLIEQLQALKPGADRPAWRLAETVPLDNPGALARLLWRLSVAGAADQVSGLFKRGLSDRVDLDDPEGIALLLDVLQKTGHEKQIDVLLARDPAVHVQIDDGAVYLFGTLSFQERIVQAAKLARRVAIEGSARDPGVAVKLMGLLAMPSFEDGLLMGMPGLPGVVDGLPREIILSFAGRLSKHLPIDDQWTVSRALHFMKTAGANEAAVALAKRVLASGDRESELRKDHFWESRELEIVDRPPEPASEALPTLGRFRDFQALNGNAARYRFGREPDGTPAEPWGWEHLD
jgi:transcriptional regulator with XRE-family HTH domain